MKNQTMQSFMAMADMETITADNIIEKIARKLLFNLFCRGNNNAYDIYTGVNNGIITIEDLVQEMYIYLLEHPSAWYVLRTTHRYSTDEPTNSLVFLDDDVARGFYRVISNVLYANIRKHDRKKLWIEIDGETVKIDDIAGLASHTCIDDVMTLSMYQGFLSYILTAKPKKAELYTQFIDLRVQGHKIRECAKLLNVKETAAFDAAKQIKTLWK